MDDEADTIEFKIPEKDDRPPAVIKPLRGTCRHIGVILDTDLRRVECRQCQEVLDPFQVLVGYAHYWSELDRKYERIHELEKEAAELRAAEAVRTRNVKQSLRSPEEKTMSALELAKHHLANGCPPHKMTLTANRMNCYCGAMYSRRHHKELEHKVLDGRERQKKV